MRNKVSTKQKTTTPLATKKPHTSKNEKPNAGNIGINLSQKFLNLISHVFLIPTVLLPRHIQFLHASASNFVQGTGYTRCGLWEDLISSISIYHAMQVP